MNTAAMKRTYSNLPVWIVEDHHHVVPHIYRAIGSRHIPMKNVKMVHFDSHPDLLIPVSMPAHTVFDKEVLFSELSIENWIMPMAYAGHMSHVAWLHPYWAQQIREGEHVICVGQDKSTGTIRVTSTDDYFLSDALYVPVEQLEKAKPLHLYVICVDPVEKEHKSSIVLEHSAAKKSKPATVLEGNGKTGTCGFTTPDGSNSLVNSSAFQNQPAFVVGRIKSMIQPDDPYILDIDLDFFSCKNPFKELYTQEEFSILQELYNFKRPSENADEEELSNCVEKRTQQLEDLEAVFADLLEDDSQLSVERLAAKLGMKSLVKLVSSLKTRNESPDYEMVHQAGLTCDYSELPHHISSEGEIQQLLLSVQFILQDLHKPTIVTMSRSSLDEYCPLDQVDLIQSSMLNILETLFGTLEVHKEYVAVTADSTAESS